MKKPLLSFLFLFTLVTLLTCFQQQTYAQFSGKVLFVTVPATATDSVVRNKFTAWGLTCEVSDIATFKTAVPADTTLAKYAFVYVSEACKSADLTCIRGLNAPIFTHKSYLAPKATAGYCSGAAQNVLTNGKIDMIDSTASPLSAGFAPGTTLSLVSGTSKTKYINYFPRDPNVPMIGIAKVSGGDTTKNLLVAVGIEKGTLVYASSSEATPSLKLKARVAILGINTEANAYYTDSAWALTKAGVAWVMASGTVGIKDKNVSVSSFRLNQNYPNPFNPTTVISYQLPTNSLVSLQVYDMLGKEVATLMNREQSAGTHEVSFNASNVPSGMYICTLRAGSFSQTKKMLLVK